MKNNWLKFSTWKIVFLLNLLSLYGCVGVDVISSTGTEYHHRYDPLSLERGELKQGSSVWNISKDQVFSAWGAPDEIITIDENHIKWIYHRELAWHGVFVWVIVPIPLVVPFGARNTEVIFEGNAVTGIFYHTSNFSRHCWASLFATSHSGLTWGGVDCSFEKIPWTTYGRELGSGINGVRLD